MNDTIISREMVYYTGEKKFFKNFSGTQSCLDEKQRFDFLKHYEKAARAWYDDEKLDSKAVIEEEISASIEKYSVPSTKHRRVITFDKMTAFTAEKACSYKNLHLYCGAKMENGEILLKDKEVRPNPSAKYVLLDENETTRLSFEVFVSEDYECSQKEKIGVEQAGRSVELRNDTLEKIKVKIYNTGEVYALSENKWEFTQTYIGRIKFGQYNHIEIVTNDTEASVALNGEITNNLKCIAKGNANNLFFDGGMHPRGYWKIRNLCINNKEVAFEKTQMCDVVLENGCEVTLPYAIGGFKERDKQLYLTAKFDVKTVKGAILDVQTLNPCGKVWINDTLVIDAENFLRNKVCITKALKCGENEIKVLVEPRAPEVFYYWHRHTDCYNGWYCGEVSISFVEDTYIEKTEIKTIDVSDKVSFEAEILLNKPFDGIVKLYCAKTYPVIGEEFLVGEFKINSSILKKTIEGDFELWDTKNPNLYAIRCELCDNEKVIDDFVVETGFRTIRQSEGSIYLNNKKVLLNGALIMQFLPPLSQTPIKHNCPDTREIYMQALMIKKMNGNTMRIHILGYGTDDVRYARICDRLGIMLIWTTGLIDSAESVVWNGDWMEGKTYQRQMREVINNPSVIMWEGSNEYHPKTLEFIDKMYDEYVKTVKEVDSTRLISPCSHLYYGGGLYDVGCKYYNDEGSCDENGEKANSGFGWRDENVVRSAHTYDLLLGYGSSWERMEKQDWKWQENLLESKKHAYLITEYAVTALANPNTPEALDSTYIESYERVYEDFVLGRTFSQDEWKESQAYQAICAQAAIKKMHKLGIDGMLWCCLTSGANDGSYLKPVIDFYGYKKLGFYALADSYRDIYACKNDSYISYGTENELQPVILNTSCAGTYRICIEILNEDGTKTDEKIYEGVKVSAEDTVVELPPFKPIWKEKGYYTLCYKLCKTSDEN